MKQLAITLLLFIVPAVAAGDLILIIKKDGSIVEYNTTTGVTGPTKYQAAYIEQGVSPGDPPDNPTTPTLNPTAEKAYNAAAGIGSKQDAAILSAVYRYFADALSSGNLKEKDIRENFAIARRLAVKDLSGDWSGVFDSWDTEMKTVVNLSVWMGDVSDGLASFAGTSSSSLLERSSDQPEEIELGSILMIIEAIVQLLKLLGIL